MAMAGAPAQAAIAPFQMRRRNVDVTGDFEISFCEIFVDEPGHFIHDQAFNRNEFYYEVRVDRIGDRSVLNYGVTPQTLCLSNSLPENDEYSTVYKVTEGGVLVGKSGRPFNESDRTLQVGDVFGCGIKFDFEIASSIQSSAFTMRKVFFTKNRRELGYVYQKVPVVGVCPYIGLGSDDKTVVQMTFPATCEDFVLLAPPVPTDNIWAYSRFFNVLGDGEVLEYFGEGTTTILQNGFAQAKRPMSRFNDYFTVTLDDLGHLSRIMVGVASRNFPNSTVLGINPLSVGLYLERGILVCYDRGVFIPVNYGPPMVGDMIKVKVIFPDGYIVPPARRRLLRGNTSEDFASDLESQGGEAPSRSAEVVGHQDAEQRLSSKGAEGDASQGGEAPSRSEEVVGHQDAEQGKSSKGAEGDASQGGEAPSRSEEVVGHQDAKQGKSSKGAEGDASQGGEAPSRSEEVVGHQDAQQVQSSKEAEGDASQGEAPSHSEEVVGHQDAEQGKSSKGAEGDASQGGEAPSRSEEVVGHQDAEQGQSSKAAEGDAIAAATGDLKPSPEKLSFKQLIAQWSGSHESSHADDPKSGPNALKSRPGSPKPHTVASRSDAPKSEEAFAKVPIEDEPKPESKPGLPGSKEPEDAKDEKPVSESRGQPEGGAQAEPLQASGQAAGLQAAPSSPRPETFRMRRPSQSLSDCGVSLAGTPSSSSDERDLGDDVDRNYVEDEVRQGDSVSLADVLFYHVVPHPGQQPNVEDIHLGTVHALRVPYSGLYPTLNFISRGARVTVDLNPLVE